jgi:hypothetical protein
MDPNSEQLPETPECTLAYFEKWFGEHVQVIVLGDGEGWEGD